ncbi:MAG: archaetidylserine decarboxylase [Wenzhouxiangella sp.]
MTRPVRDRLAVWPQYPVPHRALTALARRLSQCRVGWFKNLFIRIFVRIFGVDLEEAERSRPGDYECFDDFFTRALEPGARPLADASHRMVCPCDGTVSRLGSIDDDTLIQAKGIDYTAADLLGSDRLAGLFGNGRFATVYLAPRDYHRVHSPIAGTVMEEVRIPGRLFSVSAATVRRIPRLFTRNERMIAILDTEIGPVAVVMVAAMLVAGIETAWGPPDRQRPGKRIRDWRIGGHHLARGAELGRFHWGSTVIVLTPAGAPPWHPALEAACRVRMGQPLTAAAASGP